MRIDYYSRPTASRCRSEIAARSFGSDSMNRRIDASITSLGFSRLRAQYSSNSSYSGRWNRYVRTTVSVPAEDFLAVFLDRVFFAIREIVIGAVNRYKLTRPCAPDREKLTVIQQPSREGV